MTWEVLCVIESKKEDENEEDAIVENGKTFVHFGPAGDFCFGQRVFLR